MESSINRGAFKALLYLVLLLAFLAGSLPAGATLPSWQEVNAVHREGLLAAAHQYLPPAEVELLQQAIDRDNHFIPRGAKEVKPPLVLLKNGRFIGDLVDLIKPALARGEAAKVKQFFQAVNRQKLIRGYGRFFLVRGGYGGPMVIKLDLLKSPQKEYQVEVWYHLVPAGSAQGKKQDGPRRTLGTGVTAPDRTAAGEAGAK